MIGAVTMKITSRTSMTSTSGVTLICDIEPFVPPRDRMPSRTSKPGHHFKK
jgi:hypothetical protein